MLLMEVVKFEMVDWQAIPSSCHLTRMFVQRYALLLLLHFVYTTSTCLLCLCSWYLLQPYLNEIDFGAVSVVMGNLVAK